MKNAAIVLSAGAGSRMKSEIPKQYLDLCGMPIIARTLMVFEESENIDYIVLVVSEPYIEFCQKEIIEKYGFKKIEQIVTGGKERYNSVRNGLEYIHERDDADVVVIHDGARPFADDTMIYETISGAKKHGAASVAVPSKDTVKIVKKTEEGLFGDVTPDRNYVYQMQTPQTFKLNKIFEAYRIMEEVNETNITDDTMIIEKFGKTATLIVEGSYNNIKITTPEDMKIAENIVKNSLKK